MVLRLEPGQRVVVPPAAAESGLGKSLLQAVMTAAVYAAYLALTSLW